MHVTIHYCKTCGFRPRAEAIAEALKAEFELTTDLREAFWGTFRIEQGQSEIYNRRKTRGLLGRFGFGRNPNPTEIISILRPRVANNNSPIQEAPR